MRNARNAVETKFCAASGIKLTDGEAGVITGYGAIFGNKDLGGDIIVPGAFLKSINDARNLGHPVPMYFQHDRNQVAGVWTDMVEDENGLLVTGRVNMDKQLGRELVSDMKFGSVTGLSIGYRTIKDQWDEATSARMLIELKLVEISAVCTPMNPLARITGIKDDDEDAQFPPKTIREFEKALRDELGFSRSVAKAIASRGFKAATDVQQDAVADVASSEDETVVSDGTGHAPRDEDGDTKKALEALLAEMKSARGKFLR